MSDSKKYDKGKLRWDLLPLNLIEKVVEIYTFGAEKYGANTWQNLEDGYNRYKAAMFRHLMEFEKGNIYDDESKLEHLAHMVWNGIAMLYLSRPKDAPLHFKFECDNKTLEQLRRMLDEEKLISDNFSRYDVLVWDDNIGRRYMCSNRKDAYLYSYRTGGIIGKYQGEINNPREARGDERKVYYDSVNDYKERNV